MDQMTELDIEVLHPTEMPPVAARTTVADALPGLGIVAAVLRLAITMGALGGPPEEIGAHAATALVGTFLGILLCDGVMGPLTANMRKTAELRCPEADTSPAIGLCRCGGTNRQPAIRQYPREDTPIQESE